MSYRGGRSNGFGGRSRGGGRGGRGGRNYQGGGRGSYNNTLGSETCRNYIGGKCEFTQPGRTCRFPHFVKKIGQTRSHQGTVTDVVMWASRSQLFTSSVDATIKLWDCATWNEITTLSVASNSNAPSSGGFGTSNSVDTKKKETQGVNAMVLEGSFLFVGFSGPFPHQPSVPVGMIRGWNLDNPAQALEFHMDERSPYAHTMPVQALAVAIDSTGNATLFSGSSDGSIRYWQMDTATQSFQCRGVMIGHVRGVTRLKTFMIGTTPILASASIDTTIRLWDVSTYQCVHVLDQGHTEAIMDLEMWINGSETFLISGGLDGEIIVWNMSPPFNQLFKETQDAGVTALCGTTDIAQVSLLLVGLNDGSIMVKELPSFGYKTTFAASMNHGHSDAIRRLTIGPSNTFFSVSSDRTMIAWQITGEANSISSK